MNLRLVQEAVPISGTMTGVGRDGLIVRKPPVVMSLVLFVMLALTLQGLAFDHAFHNYSEVLSQFVRDGRVDYSGLCANRAALDRFLGEASVLSFEEYQTFSREQKMAFMINLYNAAALALVCDHPGMKSIDELKGIFHDAWSVNFIRLFNRTIGLSQLLHEVLRPEFKDSRVHFALVTATRGDADLLDVPYRAEILNQQLDHQVDQFMTQRPDANRYENDQLYLSPKFRWYAVDFGDRNHLIAFAQRYFPQVTAKTPIRYTEYDWSLNGQGKSEK